MTGALGGLRGIWSWYQVRLEKQPVRTQVITSGLLWALGDVFAQSVERRFQRQSIEGRKPYSTDSKPSKISSDSHEDGITERKSGQDWGRVLRSSSFGAGFVGPVGHFWYQGLDYVVGNRMKLVPNSMSFIGTKLFCDTFIFGPLHLLAFFTYMGLAYGKPFEQVKKDVKRDFLPTYMTEGTMWFVVQIGNFRFVPVKDQLLFVNCVCIIDSAFLSWVKHQDDAPWKRWLTSLVSPKDVKKS